MVEQTTLSGSTVKEEERVRDLMDLLVSIFTTPVNTKLEGDSGSASEGLAAQATSERMIRLMRIAKDTEAITKQTEKDLLRLTDAEKLAILSNVSLQAPLSSEYFEEMQRLFLRVKGEKAYRSVFGEEDPRPPPEWIDLWKGK